MDQKKALLDNSKLDSALGTGCNRHFGALDQRYLCQSIGTLNPPEPLTVEATTSLAEVLRVLQSNKVGCVIVTDPDGKLDGIFSERDWILKVAELDVDIERTPVSEVMTRKPVSESMNSTIAFALSLMSQGGFRHLPIVDQEHIPIGIVSVKDVVDHMVLSCLQELLDF
ncbi:MAG: CBS domain-containing protein [Bdellovibrionales bacterium]|nr:CBS domain-containing protein [Bdellovibrionales bacterium]